MSSLRVMYIQSKYTIKTLADSTETLVFLFFDFFSTFCIVLPNIICDTEYTWKVHLSVFDWYSED